MRKMPWRVFGLALGVGIGLGILPAPAVGAPQIERLSLRGLQIGGTTKLTVEGADLLPSPHIILPVSIASQVVQPGATANRVEIAVTLPRGLGPGMTQLRLATDRGMSNPILMGIDDLPQLPFATLVDALPVALHGKLSGSASLQTSFTGKKGQRVVIDLEARRLGSAIDPVIELHDPRHVQLAWSQGRATLQGDARIEAVLPANGRYTVELHDVLYQAGSPDVFRLKIGDLHFADQVFPLTTQRGKEEEVELVGQVPAAATHGKVDLRKVVGDVPAPLPALAGMVGPAPRIRVSDLPVVRETTQAMGKLQEVEVPAIINGRISKPGEEDRYRLRVKPGMKLRFNLVASRAGSPLDGILTLQNDAGGQLAASDDQADTTDPGLEYTVPDGIKSLVALISDLEGRGGPNSLYSLAVTAADGPDFSLELFADRIVLPREGTAMVRVRAARAGYQGPIKLTLPDLPTGVGITGEIIPAGATDTLVSLQASTSAPPAAKVLHLVGESAAVNPPLRRPALLPGSPVTERQPWLRGELGFAIIGPEPLRIAWDGGNTSLPIGSTHEARVRLFRAAPATGSVRLSLLTSQVVPRTADGKQEDMNRALRLASTPSIAAGQSSGAVSVLVPADLPALPYDLAIRAELLGADGQTVLASAITPSRRVEARPPLQLQVAGAPSVQARSGAGPTGKVTGKVVRTDGFNKPVTITLTGLPAEVPTPSIMVQGDRNEFELPVSFPFATKTGPLSNVRLVATSEVAPGQRVASNEVPLTVEVIKGEPPPPPPALYRIFDDEPLFLAQLTEGDGQAAVETGDRYSGTAALQVRGTQRYRTQVPGWGFKITAKPGPGEFRYLRFAWKKRGGDNIMLQLNANGNWGPQRGASGPAYRYEAGPGDNPFKAAAIRIDSHLPDDWVVVTRDLFADFGAFTLSGIAFTPGPGDYALFDHLYLARSLGDFKPCPPIVPAEKPLVVFEDQGDFVDNLIEGNGTATLDLTDKYSGSSSVKVTPDQRFNEELPGLKVNIRQNPGPGEYRFLRFAWKKKGGQTICLQLNHDGQWGPVEGSPGKFRYHAGAGPEPYGASLPLDNKLPSDWVVVTRDLFADFGEFTLTGLALSPVDGEYARFDHIYLGRTTRDFELVKPK
jgi:hypothetical protein